MRTTPLFLVVPGGRSNPLDPDGATTNDLARNTVLVMDTTLASLRVWPLWQKARHLAVSGVHEDSATGARAEEFCQTLARGLGNKCAISRELWLATELQAASLRAIAAAEAAAADLVIVSVHHAETLPDEVKRWLDLWLKPKRRRPAVLLALFDPLYLGSSAAIQSYLQNAAQRGHREFLARTEEKPFD
ncbi:MAG TPA: hypothetical protein PLV05_06640 [Verrucomicrobiota bacterium]|jgi:hypothetical protein|nr:hypothetical protein [Verrucomicrobiota bacterium]HRR65896.1 hypothetical protein [Candidatus Paceibacterota bacterium]MBP8016204.1 hypothetical protein [Verrucomicrobiota bacterium]MDI9372664.1 hypothetical protein [Verrucomicrobiota bacterium]NLH86300.1 hypothetical protein [Verrucomicrobiota bacterium]